jgi:hypothetical protein
MILKSFLQKDGHIRNGVIEQQNNGITPSDMT